ncbi:MULTISPECIES: FMN-binding glutamate synthase family protein [unclassified Acetobacterium]|jgi:glutamate synthase domain-containing protein 2|uniref:FMN-binding glutamate synthase family protein n=1 Tax=unclassified Acetobacterium TaxID=2638182 RepID=UPI000DBEBB88|nr:MULTISPECIES: FMN-binding glutamate synthase family protein [unclassified Acetobacterium]AWW27751.1 FMN-binding glutamate synthase family protein [Acetobacterium sp. KB-1]MDZ5725960.1 FMN-binding glutamate synthase family protein [Acetobacterium sp. K1/6]
MADKKQVTIHNAPKATWNKETLSEIDYKATNGKYRIRGCGSPRPMPKFDDLMILPSQLTRMPIDTYREDCETRTVLGARFAKKPLIIETPVMIAGMSYGALSKEAKIALAKATKLVGTVISNGEGGILPEELENSYRQSVQILASRMGFTRRNMEVADMLEVLYGIGAKPGLSGHLMGEKISEEIAEVRKIPIGIDLHSHPRAGDAFGADDMVVKMQQLREMTDWETPIFCKIAAGRVRDDIKIAIKLGFDGIILDGCSAGTGAAPVMATDHLGIPTMPALVAAVRTLEEMGVKEEMSLIVSGGITNGADLAKALAIGADAVAIGTAAMVAMGCRVCMNCQTGKCAFGIGTQDPELRQNLDVDEAAERVANYIKAITAEAVLLAKSAGKTKLKNLEREDLRALTLEACAMTGIPLVGSDLVIGKGFGFSADNGL